MSEDVKCSTCGGDMIHIHGDDPYSFCISGGCSEGRKSAYHDSIVIRTDTYMKAHLTEMVNSIGNILSMEIPSELRAMLEDALACRRRSLERFVDPYSLWDDEGPDSAFHTLAEHNAWRVVRSGISPIETGLESPADIMAETRKMLR